MKAFIVKNRLQIIIAGIILLFIPAVIIIPKIIRSTDISGIYEKYAESGASYIHNMAEIEGLEDGSYKVVYTNDCNFIDGRDNSCEFIIPKDYEYGSLIDTEKGSRIKTVLFFKVPGAVCIRGYSDTSEEVFSELLLGGPGVNSLPDAVSIALWFIIAILTVILAISILIRLRRSVIILMTIVYIPVTGLIYMNDSKNINYEGIYEYTDINAFDVNIKSFNRFYIKKTAKDSYLIISEVYGYPLFSSMMYSPFNSEISCVYVQEIDGKIFIPDITDSVTGLKQKKDTYIEKTDGSYYIYQDDNSEIIIYELTRTYGLRDFTLERRIIMGLPIPALIVTIIIMLCKKKDRKKQDIFASYYGEYVIEKMIFVSEEYQDFAKYAFKSIEGGIVAFMPDRFIMNDNTYDSVKYNFDSRISIPEEIIKQFRNAKKIEIKAQDNKFIFLHCRNAVALITFLGDRMVMGYGLKNTVTERE